MGLGCLGPAKLTLLVVPLSGGAHLQLLSLYPPWKVSGRTQESSAGAAGAAGAASAARLSPVQAPGQLNQECTAGALGFSHTGLLVGCFAQYIKFLCTFW